MIKEVAQSDQSYLAEGSSSSKEAPFKVRENVALQQLFEEKGGEARKKVPSLGRLIDPSEFDEELLTYVKKTPDEVSTLGKDKEDCILLDDGNYAVVEDTNILDPSFMVTCNPDPIGFADGKPIYNEWTQPLDGWLKNYGIRPTDKFQEYKKIRTIRLLEITDEVMELVCGDASQESAQIYNNGSPDGITMFKGGFLVDAGYPISQNEFQQTYEFLYNPEREEKLEQYKRHIERLPISDLHVHPTGSMSPLHALVLGERHYDVLKKYSDEGSAPALMKDFLELVKERNLKGITELLSTPSEETLSLGEYFSRYSVLSWLLQSPKEVAETAYSVGKQSVGRGVNHIELRLSPITPGIEEEQDLRNEVIKNLWHNYWGLALARKESPGFSFSLISILPKTQDPELMQVVVDEMASFCRLNEEDAIDRLQELDITLGQAKEFGIHFQSCITGFDTAGPEVGFEFDSGWKEVFSLIKSGKEEGLWSQITTHAGESWQNLEDGLRRMEDAIDNGAERLGHGIAAGIDPDLLEGELDETKSVSVSNFSTKADELGVNHGHILAVKDDIGNSLIASSKTTEGYYRFSDRIRNKEHLAGYLESLDSDGNLSNCLLFLWDAAEGLIYSRERIEEVKKQQNELIRILAEKGVAVEINLSSNIGTGNVDHDGNHPFYRLRREGVPIVIGTDALFISDTTISTEIARLAIAQNIPMKDIESLVLEMANRFGFQSLENVSELTKEYIAKDETQKTESSLKAIRLIQEKNLKDFASSGLSAQEIDMFVVLLAQPDAELDSGEFDKITSAKSKLEELILALKKSDSAKVKEIASGFQNGDKLLIRIGLFLSLYFEEKISLLDLIDDEFIQEQASLLVSDSDSEDSIDWWHHILGISNEERVIGAPVKGALKGAELKALREELEKEASLDNLETIKDKIIGSEELKGILEKSGSKVISFTGFSKQNYHESQSEMLDNYLDILFSRIDEGTYILVGGNDMGIDKIVAEAALKHSLKIISVIPKAGLEYDLIDESDYFVVEGETWPDDTKAFLGLSDMMVVAGGGKTVRSRIDLAHKFRIPVLAIGGFPGASDEAGGKYEIANLRGLQELVTKQILMIDPKADVENLEISKDYKAIDLGSIIDHDDEVLPLDKEQAEENIDRWNSEGKKVILLSGDIFDTASYLKTSSQIETLFSQYIGHDKVAFSIVMDEDDSIWSSCVKDALSKQDIQFQFLNNDVSKQLMPSHEQVIFINASVDNDSEVDLTCEAIQKDKGPLTLLSSSLSNQLGIPGLHCGSAFDLAEKLVALFGEEVLRDDYAEDNKSYDLRSN